MPHASKEDRRAYERRYWAERVALRRRHRYYQDKARHANRRARIYGVPGSITTADVRQLLDGAICHYCHKPDEAMTLDHRHPMHAGGPNIVANIVPACGSCNKSKWRQDLPHRWSRTHDSCIGCGRADRKHIAKGFCNPCYLSRFGARAKARAERGSVPTPGD